MKRVNVTVSRNDVRPEGFKRWTVYAGDRAVFDIEATAVGDGSLILVGDATPTGYGSSVRPLAMFDSRSDSFVEVK